MSKQEDVEIVDISDKEVAAEDLVRQEEHHPYFIRYNRAQVQRIVELVYIPYQVAQYNASVTGRSDRRYPQLDKDLKPVSLEQIKPLALEDVGRLFDAYSAIPKGTSFMTDYGDSNSISCKRFDGFVVKELEFWMNLRGGSIETPDPNVFIPWYSTTERGVVHFKIGGGTFFPDSRTVDVVALRKYLSERYADLQKRRQIAETERLKQAVDNWRKGGDDWYKDQGFSSWDAYLENRLANIGDPGFVTYRSRAQCRDAGFVPSTGRMKSFEELFGFTTRFLAFQEPGEPYSEEAYLRAHD